MKVILSRVALILTYTAVLTIPSFAQTTSGTRQHNPLSRLQKALNLSSTQVSQIQGLMQSQRAAMQTLRADIKTRQQALLTALQGSDTSVIGTALLALRSSETALKNAETANHNALMAVLTPAQAQIVSDYLTLAKAGGAGPLGDGSGGHFGRGWHHQAGS